MTETVDLDAITARHGEWYGDGEDYLGPAAQWPDRDPGEDKAHYIVRNDIPALTDEVRALRAALAKSNAAAVAAYDGNALIQQANARRDDALDTLREIVEAVVDGHDVPRTVRGILDREGLIPEPVEPTPAQEVAAMREALKASLVYAMGDTFGAERMIKSIVGSLQDRRDAQAVLRSIPKTFTPHVYGQVLLFHLEAHTPLAGHAESITPGRFPDRDGLTIADLGWPADMLHPAYLDDAAEWSETVQTRFAAAVQAWRDAHPGDAR